MNWLELAIEVDTESVEVVAELLQHFTYGGVVIEQEVASPNDGELIHANLEGPITIKGYLPIDEDSQIVKQKVEESLWHLHFLGNIGPLRSKILAEEDWSTAWKEHYQVQHTGTRLVIKPSWRDYQARPGEIIVVLDPGMAFGTGLHPSTRLCLLEMENWIKPSTYVLDFGTGSGILGIAAAKLGASHVVALDVDEVAIQSAWNNVHLNNLEGIVTIFLGTLSDLLNGKIRDAPLVFDLILANITAKVIMASAENIALCLRSEGILISSGIIQDQAERVCAVLRQVGINIIHKRQQDDWIALVGQKSA
ncbi:MAG: 50S ribosomal protein L11 methyltransferase [Chloroflexi bacterium]|nr:50S ribosomal protein L11 methyltransferase [Chloroflexota bacterium]MCL5074372.1 50S ribosomal protein L11 methyltransferase [Chloroflexota bacterium]